MQNSLFPVGIFYENFNTSNASSPHFDAHVSYITNPKYQECGVVNQLEYAKQCAFVMANEGCHQNVQFIDYTNFLYCTMSNPNDVLHYIGVILLIFQCVYMFAFLGTTADRFFCPCLAVISSAMGLTENLAGVTLLAFGNGSPDIFTAITSWNEDTELLAGELFGAAIFVISVVSGFIMIVRPFTVDGLPLLRDVIFFIAACVWLAYWFGLKSFNYFAAVGTISIYMIYLVLVITDHCITKKKFREMQAEVKNIKGDQRETAAHLAELNEKVNFQYRKSSRGQLSNINLPIKSHLNATKPNDKIFQQFLNSLNPIDKEEWDEDGCFGRFLSILKIPIVVILTLVIPVVDYTWANHGWSKLLNILHIIILPLMLCLSNGWLSISFYGVPVGAYCVLGSLPVCIIVFYTSRTDRPPKYHLAYAVFGSFVGSIVTISTFASEVVAILSTLGVVSNLSNSMLGLSVLAWGNSIGDLMSNVALARQGYTKMGFSACFGGPFFNSIFGMGIVFLLKLYHTGKSAVFARSGAMGVNCSIFLFITLSFTGMIFVCTKFQARRSNGIFLLMLYTCFLASVFLGEFEIVHPYGTDHRNEGDIQ